MSNDPHRHRAASSDVPAWQCRLRTLGYSVFFPLLFVVAVVTPLVVASSTSLTLFRAAEYTLVVVAVGYTVGLGLLLR
jgi:hypothetical protein